jgi:hypothetical protein
MTLQQRFEHLQARAKATADQCRDYAIDLRVKYGDAYYRGWIGGKEKRRLDQLQRADTRETDRFVAFLVTIQGRDFRRGVPQHWLLDNLTYADAITTGKLSQTPPPAYGYSIGDSQRFAAAIIPQETAANW